MVDYVCLIQEGQAADRLRGELEAGLARIGAECFGDDPAAVEVSWVAFSPGFAWTEGKPSTSSLVVRSVPVGFPDAEREAYLHKVSEYWVRATGCSIDEVVATAWDGPLPLG